MTSPDVAMGLLGLRVRDKLTGFKGVVTTVGFDLYGCIEALVTPAIAEGGRVIESRWFGVERLSVESTTPVMAVPNFKFEKGPESKPITMRDHGRR